MHPNKVHVSILFVLVIPWLSCGLRDLKYTGVAGGINPSNHGLSGLYYVTMACVCPSQAQNGVLARQIKYHCYM